MVPMVVAGGAMMYASAGGEKLKANADRIVAELAKPNRGATKWEFTEQCSGTGY